MIYNDNDNDKKNKKYLIKILKISKEIHKENKKLKEKYKLNISI